VKAGFQEGPKLCEEQELMKVEACMKDGHFSAGFARESTDVVFTGRT
jgi:hypothetical protein